MSTDGSDARALEVQPSGSEQAHAPDAPSPMWSSMPTRDERIEPENEAVSLAAFATAARSLPRTICRCASSSALTVC